MIPTVDPTSGLLPPGIFPATLDEIYDVFVTAAPFREERELIFKALSVYLDILDSMFLDSPRYLLNGGFVTHKTWAAPKDVDLAIGLGNQEFKSAYQPKNVPAWTLHGVSHVRLLDQETMFLERVQPMVGLVDSHVFARKVASLARSWERQWSRVKGEDGKTVPGLEKGFLEVIR